MGWDDEIPDHSVLSKARKRWGKEVSLSLFSRVVHRCVDAGLVAGSKIHVDTSLVAASLGSVKPLKAEVIRAIGKPRENKSSSSMSKTTKRKANRHRILWKTEAVESFVGTLDGTNVEIREEVGADNFFLFRLNAEQLRELKSRDIVQ
jgi:hypothetical protein